MSEEKTPGEIAFDYSQTHPLAKRVQWDELPYFDREHWEQLAVAAHDEVNKQTATRPSLKGRLFKIRTNCIEVGHDISDSPLKDDCFDDVSFLVNEAQTSRHAIRRVEAFLTAIAAKFDLSISAEKGKSESDAGITPTPETIPQTAPQPMPRPTGAAHGNDCYCTECVEKRLIAATNLLGEVAGSRLPDGWTIELSLGKKESSMTLCDPEGNDVEFSGGEWGYSGLSAAIDTAIKSIMADAAEDGFDDEDYGPREGNA